MNVIIAAAGTGGHINPGIAIANKIKEKEPNSNITFIGTTRGLENDLVPRAGYKLKTIEAYGFSKKISFENFMNVYKTFKSKKNVIDYIDKFKPNIVIGTGGYICVPTFSAAKARNIPIVIHESNAFPGKTTKMFAKKADEVLVGFEDAKKRLKNARNVIVTGNPTKVQKIDIPEIKKKEIKEELGLKTDLPIVLVFGGSQGAQSINESFIGIIENKLNKDFQIIWSTGPRQFDVIKDELSKRDININNIKNVKIVPYIYNMEEILNLSDLVVCRSGAMTITEICIVGKPAIFIPFPYAAENHQEYNARVLEKVGAAKIILNSELSYKRMFEEIQDIILNKKEVEEMGILARSLAPFNVEDKIYKEILRVAKKW